MKEIEKESKMGERVCMRGIYVKYILQTSPDIVGYWNALILSSSLIDQGVLHIQTYSAQVKAEAELLSILNFLVMPGYSTLLSIVYPVY